MPFLKFSNPFEKAQPQAEDYLSLTITPDKVIATIWKFAGEQVEVLSCSEKNYGSQETLVHEAAVAIDTAAQEAKTDVTKVVFGLSAFWFENGKLTGDASKVLKNLSSDLELDAQAYVTMAIAINHLLKAEESVTPQAVLIGTFPDFTEINLIKNNKVLVTKTVAGELTVHKVLRLLDEIKQGNESIPSKIIVFGSLAFEMAEKLKTQSWHELFVHEPKIETFDDKMMGKSVAFAQAADVLGHDPALAGQKKGPEQVVSQTAETYEAEQVETSFGFVEGRDILEKQMPQQELVEQAAPPFVEEPLDPENFAVEIDQSDNLRVPPNNLQAVGGKAVKPRRLGFRISKFMPFSFSIKKLLIIFAVLAALILGGIFIAGQTLTAAQVVIKTNPKTESFDFSAKIISGSANNFEKGEIAGTMVTGSAENGQKAVATGSKKTGTKSKGEIVLQNWTKEEVTFPSSTELITKDGLKFRLDTEAKSATDAAHPPGKVKVNATAFDVGDKYNIAVGTELSLVGKDPFYYDAKVEGAFSGGEEKQITVVSKEDLTRLEKTLTDSLTEKAKEDLAQKTGGMKIYDESKIVKITKKELDKKADEEASLVNLNMKLDLQVIAFDENDLKSYLAELANKKQTGTLQALPQTIDIGEVKVKREKDTLTVTGKYEAGLVPKFKEDEIREKIAGKSVKQARETVKSVGDVSDIQFIFTPTLPFVDSLPRNKSKITFKIESS